MQPLCRLFVLFIDSQKYQSRIEQLNPFVGHKYQRNKVFCSISTLWSENEDIFTEFTGRVVEVYSKQGQTTDAGKVITYLERSEIFI